MDEVPTYIPTPKKSFVTKRRLLIAGTVTLSVAAVTGAYVLGARSVLSQAGEAVEAASKAVDAAANAA